MEDYPVEVYIIQPMTSPRASATGKCQVCAGPWALEAVPRGVHTPGQVPRVGTGLGDQRVHRGSELSLPCSTGPSVCDLCRVRDRLEFASGDCGDQHLEGRLGAIPAACAVRPDPDQRAGSNEATGVMAIETGFHLISFSLKS